MKSSQLELHILDEAAMLEFGRRLAASCSAPFVIYLRGELGAGKTTLVRGFLRGLNYLGTVKSPTYTLVEPYDFGGLTIFHFDLYRLNDPQELEYVGINEYFSEQAICVIEWPERGQPFLPAADLSCEIKIADTARDLVLMAFSAKGMLLLEKLRG